MNKRELIEAVCAELETTKSAAEETVNVVLNAIKYGVASDDQVSIAGFGTWSSAAALLVPVATLKLARLCKLKPASQSASSLPRLGKTQ